MSKRKPATSKHTRGPKAVAKAQRSAQAIVRSRKRVLRLPLPRTQTNLLQSVLRCPKKTPSLKIRRRLLLRSPSR